MSSRLVLWSGGGRFVASKDVLSAAIISVGVEVEVNWGGGDIERLAGTAFTVSDVVRISASFWNGTGCVDNVFSSFYIDASRYPQPYTHVWQNLNTISRCGKANSELGVRDRNNNPILFTITNPISSNGCLAGAFIAGATCSGMDKAAPIYTVTGKKITTNVSASSYRTEKIPSVSVAPSGWAISISYVDGTTQKIYLSYQPSWVEVRPLNSCPNNTCFECTHDGEKCCFAPKEDGLLHLVDRFHITP